MHVNPLSKVNETSLHSISHYGPVTALKIYNSYIFAGYGPILKVYTVDSAHNTVELVCQKQVFARNKIHSIAVSGEGKILVCGGRSFAVVSIVDSEIVQRSEKAINEWIVNCAFLDEVTALILNSHNTVYKIDISAWESPEQQFSLVDEVDCNEKSILYSGSIRILPSGDVYIAAGTVMNGVIIWNFNTRTIVHNLTEHEGSIFGVKIDQSGKYVVSCSDDRSIKLYDLKSGKHLATGWGHGSRIWNLDFFVDLQSSSIKIMSAGEDCTVRFWQYCEQSGSLDQLELIENAHLGKHVWSSDIDDLNLGICVSGGADGKVRVHDLRNRGNLSSYSLSEISEQTGLSFHKNEIIKQYAELVDVTLFLTSHGQFFAMQNDTNTFYSIIIPDDCSNIFNNFGLMQGFKHLNLAVVCTRNGALLKVIFGKQSEQPIFEWISEISSINNNKVTNFLSYKGKNKNYFFVDCPNPQVPFTLHVLDEKLMIEKTISLVQPDRTFTSTFMHIDETNNWFILGARHASIAVFDLNLPEITLEASVVYRKICPGDTITCIREVEAFENAATLLITVRDGTYMYIKLIKDQDLKFNFVVLQENKLSKGFVEGAVIKDGSLLVYGFKSSHFYVWNETKQIEITNELCGGAHRKWELISYDEGDVDYKFIYINKSSLFFKTFKGRFTAANYGIVEEGTHGREIRDIGVSPFADNQGRRLLLTASEDTVVRLGRIDRKGHVTTYWCMNNHVSGMQRIKFIDEEFAGSTAANEEFIIWKTSKLQNSDVPLIKEFARVAPSSDIPDLRIMDFATIKVTGGFIVSAVYSDSSIKLWFLDVELASFNPIVTDRYTTCCILNVNFIKLADKTLLVTGTTDGNVTIWDILLWMSWASKTDQASTSGLGTMLIKQQLHQSGVKGIEIQYSDESDILLFTGGDDNALVVSKLSMSESQWKLEPVSFLESAASSTITSISLLAPNKIFVTSVDQIIRVFSFDGTSLKCESATYTTVSDTGCCDAFTTEEGSKTVVVGGAGLSVWNA